MARNLEVHNVSYIIALLDWRQRMMHRILGSTQLTEKIPAESIKNDNVILQHILKNHFRCLKTSITTDKL